MKYLYIVEYWVPFPQSEYGGIINVIAENDSEAFELLDDLNIQVCHRSLMYLIGTEIVWEESPMGGGLTFINPNAGAQCGCGETFTPGN